jgi:hypothetical protein
MAYEFEYSWQVDLTTFAELESLKDPRLPPRVLSSSPVANRPRGRTR